MLPRSILQYFWPALSDNLVLKTNFGVHFEWPLKTGFTVPTEEYFYPGHLERKSYDKTELPGYWLNSSAIL